jgi:hypothetical protein
MIAEVAHGFENLAQPLGVGDVIADEKGVAHGRASTEEPTFRGEATSASSVVRRKRRASGVG